jgi:methylated-DNA-[protein]-cysteine S-methyltransferase
VRALDWRDHEARYEKFLFRHYGPEIRVSNSSASSAARRSVEAYFEGDLIGLEALRTETAGTDFQRAVWAALRTIPAGATLSYGALAARIGRPKAMRAVGLANGANPIAVIVPCHRVIGADNTLTGFGGGLERKRWLLKHEQRHAPGPSAVTICLP